MRDGLGNRIAGVALGLVALAVVMVDQAPTAWAETPPPSERFTLLMGGEAVTDQKSGTRRVWCVLDGSGGLPRNDVVLVSVLP